MTVYGIYVEDPRDGNYILDTLYEDYDEAVRECLNFANSQLKKGEFIMRYGESGQLVQVITKDGFTRISCTPHSLFVVLK